MKKEFQKMNLNVSMSLYRAFKAAAASQGRTMTDVLLDAIEQYIQKYMPSMMPKKGGRQ